MAKSVQLTFRVSEKEREQLRAAAAAAGYGPDCFATWLRRTVFRAAGLPLKSAVRPEGGAARQAPPGA